MKKRRRGEAFTVGYTAANNMLRGLISRWRALEPDSDAEITETLKGVHAALCGEVGRIEGILVAALGADRYVLGAVRAEVLEEARDQTRPVAVKHLQLDPVPPRPRRGKRVKRPPANVIPFPPGGRR